MSPSHHKPTRTALPQGRVLLDAKQIRDRLRQMGEELTHYYAGEEPCFIGLLNGALFFLTDLIRTVDIDLEVHCIRVNSYVGREPGALYGMENLEAIAGDIANRRVLVIDDIFDTGNTLSAVVERLFLIGVADLKTCVLLEKKRSRIQVLRPDWVGFIIEDEFVVGYGLDYNGKYRTLDHIRVLEAPNTGNTISPNS